MSGGLQVLYGTRWIRAAHARRCDPLVSCLLLSSVLPRKNFRTVALACSMRAGCWMGLQIPAEKSLNPDEVGQSLDRPFVAGWASADCI